MKKLIIVVLLGYIFVACNNQIKQEEVTTKDNSDVEEVHNQNEPETIVLDNGNKWVVVPEMMAFIKNIENGVLDFSKNEKPSFEEYQILSKEIAKNLEDLTSNCTMTGQAHDELHKWLVPFLDLSAEFSESTNQQEAEANYLRIKESFNQFNIYFE